MNNKKVIGCPGWKVGDNSFGLTLEYIEFISRFGQLRIITPYEAENPPELDLLVLPGGADINPVSYGEMPSLRTGAPNILLEHFDANILPKYLANNTPIFGICRGFQKLFSLFGGKLVQHNPFHKQSSFHNDECHELEFTDGNKHYGELVDRVTSRHHQTCDGSGVIPNDLEVIAYSNEKFGKNREHNRVDKTIIEIFKHKNNRIFGVQFHPESNTNDHFSPEIITQLLEVN